MNSNFFLSRYNGSIACQLNCFDRVLFKGHIRSIAYPGGLRNFVDKSLGIYRKDFMPWAKLQSQRIIDGAKAMAAEAGKAIVYLRGPHRKERIVQDLLRKQSIADGLVCILSCLEHCPSFRMIRAKSRPDFAPAKPLALVFYFYFLDRDLGLIHVRVPTLFPWSIQVAVNGHDYLAQQMSHARLGFLQEDNAFVELDQPAKAQKLADRFLEEDWVKRLNELARQTLPPLGDVLARYSHYWVIDQAEFASDLIFNSPKHLAGLYPRLLDHAALNFQAQDILSFLGRRLHVRYDGEVLTECRKDRLPGARIKHRARNNWIKMYDKRRRILRIETVINNSKEFKVRRPRLRDGQMVMVWSPMNKGVSNLYRYQQVAMAANQRYLNALAAIQPPPPTAADLHRLGESCQHAGRSYAGFNPARQRDLQLFQSLCCGQHLLHGFRNADIRQDLFSNHACDAKEKSRRSAAVSRLLKRLHVRGLLLKVPHTRRWHLSCRGRELFTGLLRAHRQFSDYPTHAAAA
jgi:hypothetical protein